MFKTSIFVRFSTVLYNKIINIYSGNVKAGSCPPQRFYIKSENEICHRLCMKDDDCKGSSKCCPDNCHSMCKPLPQGKCPLPTKQLAS